MRPRALSLLHTTLVSAQGLGPASAGPFFINPSALPNGEQQAYPDAAQAAAVTWQMSDNRHHLSPTQAM